LKLSFLLILAGILFSAGCGSKRIYDEKEYLFNPTGVWNDFRYHDYDSYNKATAALRVKLREVWNKRHALGRYTKSKTDSVGEIIDELVPKDGSLAGEDCEGDSKGVAILLHGLYDSPYVMKGLGHFFNRKCYQSRFLLLPGHGTVPGDLNDLSYEQWITAVETIVERTKKEYEGKNIIIAGFSTGAGLALNFTSDHPGQVQALFLFAPLVNLPVNRVLGARLFDTLGEYAQKNEGMDNFKYESVPVDSVLQANQLARLIEGKLQKYNLKIPVFIAQAKNDYILPAEAVIELFNNGAFGPRSVFLLYAPKDDEKGFSFKDCNDPGQDDFSDTNKLACNSSFVHTQSKPDATIDDYSHMSLILPPTDPHYGINGKYRYCLHYRKGTSLKKCRTSDKPDVCYGERGLYRGQHVSEACPVFETVMIRLTSNPKFKHLETQLSNFMREQNLLRKGTPRHPCISISIHRNFNQPIKHHDHPLHQKFARQLACQPLYYCSPQLPDVLP